MASSTPSAASFAEQIGQLLIDGFFDECPIKEGFDFSKFFKQCFRYSCLMGDNPERVFPKIIESSSSEPTAIDRC